MKITGFLLGGAGAAVATSVASGGGTLEAFIAYLVGMVVGALIFVAAENNWP